MGYEDKNQELCPYPPLWGKVPLPNCLAAGGKRCKSVTGKRLEVKVTGVALILSPLTLHVNSGQVTPCFRHSQTGRWKPH